MGPQGDIHADVIENVEELIKKASHPDRIFIDIPIGLPDGHERRECDLAARKFLDQPRACSVFPAPVRALLKQSSYIEASRASLEATGRGLSQQTFAIAKKIKEVDDLMQCRSSARCMIREVHPEICFWALAGQKPMANNKKKPEGFSERLAVLINVRPSVEEEVKTILNQFKRKEVAKDDILDALVAATTASVQLTSLDTISRRPMTDQIGLRVEMHYITKDALTALRST